MGDALALNQDKLAFIHGENTVVEAGRGAEKTQAPDRSLENGEHDRKDPKPLTNRSKRRGRRPKATSPETFAAPEIQEMDYSGELPPFLISLTTRLSPATAEALRRAALEQRLRRRRPHTQQEIVEAAVRHWLTTNGFFRAA